MKPTWRKKHAGCPQWILDGVRGIREQATQKPMQASGVLPENSLQTTTKSED